MNEGVFTRELVQTLKHYGWAEHIIPSAYGMRNTPDILACVRGVPIAIEAKMVKVLPKSPRAKLMNYGFTIGQEMRANLMASAGYKVTGLINLREERRALIVPITRGILYKEDITKYKAIDYVGKGMWAISTLLKFFAIPDSEEFLQ